VLVGLKDVAEVRAVEDIFEGRKDADPDTWSVFAGYESVKLIVSQSSCCVWYRDGCLGIDAGSKILGRWYKENATYLHE
jgi:hypothetical protein